jgi:hypothetical protein
MAGSIKEKMGIELEDIHGFFNQFKGNVAPALSHFRNSLGVIIHRQSKVPFRTDFACFYKFIQAKKKSFGYL